MRKAVRIAGRDVLFVMAAQVEYGPHLQRLFTPVMTGVGPVEAGVTLGAELSWLKSEKALPDLVVSLGSAGSRTLEQTEIYQAVSVAYRDIDASPLGFEKGATPFLDLPVTVPLPFRIPGISEATLSTGAAIISGSAYDAIG
ncbi:MAG: 5'-methylthioadenosine/S-adenosylhomocysteine nucleosidase, partial [Mesorhizobium sp.]